MHLLNVDQNHGKAQRQESTGRMIAESCVELSKLIMEVIDLTMPRFCLLLPVFFPHPEVGYLPFHLPTEPCG